MLPVTMLAEPPMPHQSGDHNTEKASKGTQSQAKRKGEDKRRRAKQSRRTGRAGTEKGRLLTLIHPHSSNASIHSSIAHPYMNGMCLVLAIASCMGIVFGWISETQSTCVEGFFYAFVYNGYKNKLKNLLNNTISSGAYHFCSSYYLF